MHLVLTLTVPREMVHVLFLTVILIDLFCYLPFPWQPVKEEDIAKL